jgi:hypothetical protein
VFKNGNAKHFALQRSSEIGNSVVLSFSFQVYKLKFAEEVQFFKKPEKLPRLKMKIADAKM